MSFDISMLYCNWSTRTDVMVRSKVWDHQTYWHLKQLIFDLWYMINHDDDDKSLAKSNILYVMT
jgi:hypothetical protein